MDGGDVDGGVGGGGAFEKDEEAEERAELLRDRFRLSVISIANAEAKKLDMEVLEPVVACVADLAFKYTAHRNKHLTGLLRSFSQELKGKEPQTERKRKKSSKKEDKSIPR
ncbi:protein MHF1 homolog isoform X4 [Elaeis guineensis]|uniref:Protein MHF1 homolog isoform X2 n=1 Tax=Elaeis guineensis var. tenera TaxID=51953 RepID=A0A6I9RN67_ELAGV|nr:protein MHF1 homolog isoform X2 [Elaeis guineensis]